MAAPTQLSPISHNVRTSEGRGSVNHFDYITKEPVIGSDLLAASIVVVLLSLGSRSEENEQVWIRSRFCPGSQHNGCGWHVSESASDGALGVLQGFHLRAGACSCAATLASITAGVFGKLFWFCISVARNPVKRKFLSQVFVEDINEFSFSLIHHFLTPPPPPRRGSQFGLILLDSSPRLQPMPGVVSLRCIMQPVSLARQSLGSLRPQKPRQRSHAASTSTVDTCSSDRTE